jgi:hypothetical protein
MAKWSGLAKALPVTDPTVPSDQIRERMAAFEAKHGDRMDEAVRQFMTTDADVPPDKNAVKALHEAIRRSGLDGPGLLDAAKHAQSGGKINADALHQHLMEESRQRRAREAEKFLGVDRVKIAETFAEAPGPPEQFLPSNPRVTYQGTPYGGVTPDQAKYTAGPTIDVDLLYYTEGEWVLVTDVPARSVGSGTAGGDFTGNIVYFQVLDDIYWRKPGGRKVYRIKAPSKGTSAALTKVL